MLPMLNLLLKLVTVGASIIYVLNGFQMSRCLPSLLLRFALVMYKLQKNLVFIKQWK